MSVTLSRDEYVELFGRDEYPKSTQQAASELKQRGYAATVNALDYLCRKEICKPKRGGGGRCFWSPRDIEKAADYLAEQESYSPYGFFAQVLGIRYADYLRSLQEATATVNEEYGEDVLAENADYFIMTYHPPRLNADGYVEFELCEDIRQQLNRRRGKPKRQKGGA